MGCYLVRLVFFFFSNDGIAGKGADGFICALRLGFDWRRLGVVFCIWSLLRGGVTLEGAGLSPPRPSHVYCRLRGTNIRAAFCCFEKEENGLYAGAPEGRVSSASAFVLDTVANCPFSEIAGRMCQL